MLLHDVAAGAPDINPDQIPDQDWVEESLQITDVQPGKIWFEDGVGPIAVPRNASDLARPGWSLYLTAPASPTPGTCSKSVSSTPKRAWASGAHTADLRSAARTARSLEIPLTL